MGVAALELRGVSKSFRHRPTGAVTRALRGIDLKVEPGEIVALVGPNGAGKTTLLKILATLILPDAGNAWIAGASVRSDAERAKRLVGLLVADDRSFYARLTARQNLEFFAALGGLGRSEAASRIEELRERLGLPPLDDAYQELSTGGKQKLALARCLMGSGGILLLDEPARSLDGESAERLRDAVSRRVRGSAGAAIFTTHSQDEARRYADRIVRLEDGAVR